MRSAASSSRPVDGTAPAGRSAVRGLILGTLALSALQFAVFSWLASIPGPNRVPAPGAAASHLRRTVLAVDGLQSSRQWVSDPRRFLKSEAASLTPPRGRINRRDPAGPSFATPPQFLPTEMTPGADWQPIPSPESDPIDRRLSLPSSPATAPLALQQNLLTIFGPLQGRGFARAPQLDAWSGPEAVGSTRIEVSVNFDGEVVLARVAGSCGVKAADDLALAAIRASRFKPSTNGPAAAQEAFNANRFVRSAIELRWQSATPRRP